MSAGLLLAHGVGGRSDLPIGTGQAVVGAALAVAISVAAVTLLRRRPRERTGLALPAVLGRLLDSPAVRRSLQAVTLLVAGFVTVVALVGPAQTFLNVAPFALYITFWVGLVPVSLLLGPVWRVVNPLRLVHELLERAAGVQPGTGTRPIPGWLGWWPAAGWLLVFVWLELVYAEAADPRVVGTFLVAYAVVTVAAALAYGAAWFDRGDGFEAYSTLIGRLSPLQRRADGRLVLGSPFAGLGRLGREEREPGLLAVVLVLIGSTAFDGLTRTRFWLAEVDASSAVMGTLGLAGMIALTGGLYLLGAAAADALVRTPVPGRTSAEVFAASLVPIAVGYAVAHYFSLFLLEGQVTLILASDPFRTGADWFGTAVDQVNYERVSTTLVGFVQVGAIVVGHLLAVVLAHDRALRAYEGRDALRTQLALAPVMVLFTGLAVFLLVST